MNNEEEIRILRAIYRPKMKVEIRNTTEFIKRRFENNNDGNPIMGDFQKKDEIRQAQLEVQTVHPSRPPLIRVIDKKTGMRHYVEPKEIIKIMKIMKLKEEVMEE